MRLKLISAFLGMIFLHASGQSDTYSVNVTSFSSRKYDEFSPVFFRNGIVYCTNRNSGLFRNYLNSENKGLLKIYFVETNDQDSKLRGRIFSKNLMTRFNDGPASFNRGGDTIYFSRNLRVDGSISELSNPRNKLGIFSAVMEDNKWVKISDIRFNNEYHNITTPYISPDGKMLFFASDNPDGFGGTDLYLCLWKGDYWDDPVNLGPTINTEGNESYPFVTSGGELFFSSDGHPGLGGKDIFFTKQKGDKWLSPVSLDPPVNSEYDDFGLIMDSVMSGGFFSSKRNNSIDIYSFRTNYRQLFYCDGQRINQYCFKFEDEGKIKIDDRYLNYIWSFGEATQITGQNTEHCFPGPGRYKIRLDAVDKKIGRIVFSKLHYDLEIRDIEQPVINSPASAVTGEKVSLDGLKSHFPGSEVLHYTWHLGDGTKAEGETIEHVFNQKGDYEVKLGLMVRDRMTGAIQQVCALKPLKVFDDKIAKANFDKRQNNPQPIFNILEYDHALLNDIYSAEKDFNEDMVFQVEIITSKEQLEPENKIFKNVPVSYNVKEVFNHEEKLFSYIVSEELTLMAAYPAFREMASHGFNNARIKAVIPEDPERKELNKIKRIFGVSADAFFRINTHTLTSAGTQILDLILGFMSNYPDIRLEMAVHTDNTGSAYRNNVLSQNRAAAMVDYLVLNGVSKDRLIPKGYGGNRPVAPNYTESDRKFNRRVDFIIIE